MRYDRSMKGTDSSDQSTDTFYVPWESARLVLTALLVAAEVRESSRRRQKNEPRAGRFRERQQQQARIGCMQVRILPCRCMPVSNTLSCIRRSRTFRSASAPVKRAVYTAIPAAGNGGFNSQSAPRSNIESDPDGMYRNLKNHLFSDKPCRVRIPYQKEEHHEFSE